MSLPYVILGYAYLLMGRLEDAETTLLEGLGHREAEYGVDDQTLLQICREGFFFV